MKMNSFGKVAAFMAVAILTFSASWAAAQEASATTTVPASAQATAAPQLDYAASQVLQLAQSKVGDATIIAYINNSGNGYRLDADQIIYLQQQGLSTPVINAMLSQPKAGVLAYTAPAAPAPGTDTASSSQPTYDSQPAGSTSIVGPAVTAIDPTAAAVYSSPYYPPYYYPYSSYPYGYPAYGYYGFYPGVSVSIGLGGWRGGGYHGGFYGGGYRGGGFHGGGFHGGFHH